MLYCTLLYYNILYEVQQRQCSAVVMKGCNSKSAMFPFKAVLEQHVLVSPDAAPKVNYTVSCLARLVLACLPLNGHIYRHTHLLCVRLVVHRKLVSILRPLFVVNIEQEQCKTSRSQKDGIKPPMKELEFQLSPQGFHDNSPADTDHMFTSYYSPLTCMSVRIRP